MEVVALLWLTGLGLLLWRSLHLGLHLLLLLMLLLGLWLLLQLGLPRLHWLPLHMLDILHILHLVLRLGCHLVRVLHLLHWQMRLALLCHLEPFPMVVFWQME